MLIGDFLTRSAQRYPDKIAIICGDTRISFAELEELSNRFAWTLIEGGITCGDRVAILLENSIEAAAAIFGILKAGGVFLVVSQTVKSDKLRFILEDCSARAVVTQSIFADTVRTAEANLDSLNLVILCGKEKHVDSMSCPAIRFENSFSSHTFPTPNVVSIDVDLAALIYTSGSTGFPKGVAVSHLNVVSAANSITEYLENTHEDVIINVLPLSFDYGLYQLLMSVKVAATLVLETSFAYPFKIVERIHEERVTGFPGVPTIFSVLLQMSTLSPRLFESVRYVTNTAAALPPSHIKRLRALFYNARIYSMYGLTECKRVSFLPPEELEKRPESVGKGMPNEEIYIVDDFGRPLPPGVVGELVVRGSNVMLGYWNRPKETAKAIRPGRFPWERILYTGDLFTMDEDGYFYFVSRKDDIIKSRGEKVSPSEIERIIFELEEVKEVAVVGVPDPILGQAIKAFVVPVGSVELTEKAVIFHCARRLESFMVPKEVEICCSLPKTSTGKIDRKGIQPVVGGAQTKGG